MDKMCTTCGLVLPLTEFYRRKNGLSRGATCRRCENARVVAWRRGPGAESARAMGRRYNASEQGKQKRAEYNRSEKHKQTVREYDRSEKGRAAAARFRASEKRKEVLRRYYESGKGKATIKRYNATPKGKESSLRTIHKRRALIGTTSTLTALEWEEIKAVHGYACAYCGRTDRPLTRDHVVPLSKGGQHVKDNIVPACRSCNSRRGNRPATSGTTGS